MSDLIPQASILWRTLIEALDAGLLMLDPDGVVYANESAETLLELGKFDLIGLDEGDLLAFFQPNRLDIERLTIVLEQDLLGPRPVDAYRVVTQRRRLLVSPFVIETEEGRFRCMLLEADDAWRSKQISEKLTQDMRSPLAFATNYSDALLKRLNNIRSERKELIELAKVVRTGLEHATQQWENLSALHNTDPHYHDENLDSEPASLLKVLTAVVEQVKSHYPTRTIRATLPQNLPLLQIPEYHLHSVLSSILQELVARLEKSASVMLHVSTAEATVQVDIIIAASKTHSQVRANLFDTLPLSTAEQLVILHGGRLWVDSTANDTTTVSITLPV